ncbi:MAG: ribonuclease H-like YkuK family protein [Planctomycetota bacterium]
MWKSLSGVSIEDIVDAVRDVLGEEERIVHIGTDAKNRGFHTDFVTVVAILDPGRGGRVFYQRVRQNRMRSLAQKLFREAELSLDTALQINPQIVQDIIVHVDANEDERHRSSKYVQALAGMVLGHGFQVRVKPEAWCASNVADYVVKEKHRKAA